MTGVVLRRVGATQRPRRRVEITRLAFGFVVTAVSVMFLWSVWSFLGAILWGVVAAIMFTPINDRLLSRFPKRRNLAAILTLVLVVAMGVVPTVALSIFLLDQAGTIYAAVHSGEIDIPATFARIQAAAPGWVTSLMRRIGVTDLNSLGEQLSIGVTARLQTLAAHALTIGQGAASFLLSLAVMLYLAFFLLRDGRTIAKDIATAVPLRAEDRRMLADRFVAVVRATVKGGVLVGAARRNENEELRYADTPRHNADSLRVSSMIECPPYDSRSRA